MNTIYSPSSTLTFMTCPTLWYLKHVQGWRPRRLANPELAAAVGLGIGAGMEDYFRGIPLDVNRAVRAGQSTAGAYLQEAYDQGSSIPPHYESTLTSVMPRIEKAIRGFDRKHPFPEDWHTFIPELTFPDHGRARADLLCQTDLGPCIVDFKTKVTAQQERYIDEFLFDFETSWQMHHYLWAAREMNIEATAYAVCLVVIEPLRFYIQQWAVDADALRAWEFNARYWWTQMDQVQAMGAVGVPTPRSGTHRSRYGLCEMYDACFTLPQAAWHTQYAQRLRVVDAEEVTL